MRVERHRLLIFIANLPSRQPLFLIFIAESGRKYKGQPSRCVSVMHLTSSCALNCLGQKLLACSLMLAAVPAFGINDRVTDWLSEEVKFNQGGMALGPFDVRPRLSGTAVYDDNIYIHTGTNRADLIWVLAPGVSMASGN